MGGAMGGAGSGGVALLALLAAGCTGEKAGGPTLTGVISAGGSSGEMRPGAAYAAELSGEVFLVVYPVASATCDDAGEALGTDPDWLPTAVYEAGGCSLSVRAPFDGSLTLTDATILDATVSISCAMDDGEWVDLGGDDGWQYDGPWWQGSPETFALDLQRSEDGESYQITVAMDTYSGQFIYDLQNSEPDPGTGSVSGDARATSCDALVSAF